VAESCSGGPFLAEVYVASRGWIKVGSYPTRAAAARRAAQAFVTTVEGSTVSQVRVTHCPAEG
jgi:hypothetical protein